MGEELLNNKANEAMDENGNSLLFWRRLLEVIIINFICSLPISILLLIGMIPSRLFFWGAGLSAVVFVILNIICLRDYILFKGSIKIYFAVNYLVYFIYAVVSLGLYLLLPEMVYNLLFLQTSFLEQFCGFNWVSVLVFHLIIFLVILLAPGTIYMFLKKEKYIVDEQEPDPKFNEQEISNS